MSVSARTSRPTLAILVAGLGGLSGNGAALLSHAPQLACFETQLCVLADRPSFAAHADVLARADAFLFITGTYWDSWSSLLQRFLEEATPSEGSATWLGKPLAVWVTAHSVGGKSVLSRLQGVMSTLGTLTPPMTGVVITQASELAHRHAKAQSEDFYSLADLDVSLHNLAQALHPAPAYRAWSVDRNDPSRRWLA